MRRPHAARRKGVRHSGRDIREYGCDACGSRHAFDDGPALWALMSDKGGGEPEGDAAYKENARRSGGRRGVPFPARGEKVRTRASEHGPQCNG